MKEILVNAGAARYAIVCGKGILKSVGERTAVCLPQARKILVVSDDNVAPLYMETVKKSFGKAGFEVFEYVFPHGEQSKNPDTLIEIAEYMAQIGLSRTDAAAALGGGVCGDMTGFAAACYQRGIAYIGIPTTLLSAVDSSVGGKTAVDLRAGKNLFGAFHQPSLVICDTGTLATLPKQEIKNGLAEVVKCAMIKDAELFGLLGRGLSYETMSARCIAIKKAVVERDEYDLGLRQMLNFGHTPAHAIEKLSDYAISHGRAVAMGMVIMTRAAERSGVCEAGTLAQLSGLYDKLGLESKCEFDPLSVAAQIVSDKKRMGDEITLAIPKMIGICELVKLPLAEAEQFIVRGF